MPFIKNQKGNVTTLGIAFLVVVGILLAGVITVVRGSSKNSNWNYSIVQAQNIAESGAKRALAELKSNQSNWSWLETDISFDGTKTYRVSITDQNGLSLTGSLPIGTSEYTITSTGRVNNYTRTVTLTANITVTNGSGGGVGLSDLYPIYANENITGTILCNDQDVTAAAGGSNTLYVKNGVNFTTASNITGLPFPQYDYAKFKSETSASKFASWSDPNTATVNEGCYYYDGNLTINPNCNIDAPETENKMVVVFIDGDFTFNANNIHGNNNLVFVVNGDINFTGTASVDGCLFYAQGDINLKSQPFNLKNVFIAKGSVNCTQEANVGLQDELRTLIASLNNKMSNFVTSVYYSGQTEEDEQNNQQNSNGVVVNSLTWSK